MKRITRAQLDSAFARHERLCREAGLIPEGMHMHLEEGSPLYGRAWRVCLTGDRVETPSGPIWPKGSGCYNPPVGDSYLGQTTREAFEALWTRSAGMERRG